MNLFKTTTIRKKLLMIYVPSVVLPLIILSIVSGSLYANAITEKTVEDVLDNSTLILSHIENIINNAESCSKILTVDINEIVDEIGREDIKGIEQLRYTNKMKTEFDIAKAFWGDVDRLVYIDIYGNVISNDINTEKWFDESEFTGYVNVLADTNGKGHWFDVHYSNAMYEGEGKAVMTLGKKVLHIATGDTLGYMFVNISEEHIASAYIALDSYGSNTYKLINVDNIIVSSNEKKELFTDITEIVDANWLDSQRSSIIIRKKEDGRYLHTQMDYNEQSLKLVSNIPMSILTHELNNTILVMIVLAVGCMVIVMIGIGLVSSQLVNPIIRLKNRMIRMNHENLEDYHEVSSADEVGQLESGFNTMIDQIKALIVGIEYEQRQKRESELALMQAQIKPHFLYNSLDLIYVLTEMNRNEEASEVTKSLADFYRTVLSKGREIVTLREEMKSIIEYMNIQKVRYSDVFDFVVDMDERTGECCIPKLSIQPIVENAIYHGLKKKKAYGHIRISINKINEEIQIVIKDNGVGMEATKVSEVLNENSKDIRTHFGISNVNERLKMYFGDLYGLSIDSLLGEGTKVTMMIPCEVIGGESDD